MKGKSLLILAFAACRLCVCADTPAKNLRTDEWGYVWTNPVYEFPYSTTNAYEGMDSFVVTNTPSYYRVVTNIVTIFDYQHVPNTIVVTTNVTVTIGRNATGASVTNSVSTRHTTIRHLVEKVRQFGTAVDATNTPGNVLCTGERLRAAQPFYYAFLDGFDTRAIAKAGNGIVTSDADGNAIPARDQWGDAHTAATMRAVFLGDLKKRVPPLYELTCGENIPGIYWSSSFIDAVAAEEFPLKPEPSSFDWTQDIGQEIYGAAFGRGETRWMPVFNCMPYNTNASLRTFHPGKSQRTLSSGLFFDRVYPNINVHEPHEYARIGEVTGSVPSTVPFDLVLSNAYEDTFLGCEAITNLSNLTARHDFRQIAQADAALSLFDRTYRVDTMPVAYTNEVGLHGSVTYSAKVKCTADGNIRILRTRNGWESPDLDPSSGHLHFWVDGEITEETELSAANRYHEMKSPRMRSSGPLLSSGIVMTSGFPGTRCDVATSSEAFQTLAARVWTGYFGNEDEDDEEEDEEEEEESESGDAWLLVSLAASANDAPRSGELRMYQDDAGVEAALSVPGISYLTNGSYAVEFTAVLGAEYWASRTASPLLPYADKWNYYPKSTKFLSNGSVYAFSSFCETRRKVAFDKSIEFEEGDGYDWTDRGDWGYHAQVFDIGRNPRLWKDVLASELRILENKTEYKVNLNDPSEATGIGKSSLRAMLTNAVTDVQFYDETQFPMTESHEYFLTSEGNEFHLYDLSQSDADSITGCKETTSITVWQQTLSVGITLPLTGIYGNTNLQWSVDTNIQSVSEATWDFPQLRISDKEY